MPILGIILFLQPYIQSRFQEDAEAEINTETQRVSRLVESSLVGIEGIPGMESHTDSLLARYRESIPFDITVFNKDGIQTGSTQPSLFSTGIYSRLLNERARDQLARAGIHMLYWRKRSAISLSLPVIRCFGIKRAGLKALCRSPF
ncbi:MAG: hypothetical protein R3B47_06320 [Bacteroidia bacterium]